MTGLNSIYYITLLVFIFDLGQCFIPALMRPIIATRSQHGGTIIPQQTSSSSSQSYSSPLSMVRNIDLAEAIIFYGKESIFQETDGGNNKLELMAGVENLVDECIRDETAILAILPESKELSSILPKEITIHTETTFVPPNPRDLWTAIHSIQVQPKGFGGSSGFGRKAADPERPPLPKHCVVLCHTIDQCRAARFAGMRVLCLTDNDLADGIMFDDCWESICMDDIATPGSFWLNPPHPKDDEGDKIDIEQVMEFYESGGSESSSGVIDNTSTDTSDVDTSDLASEELDDDQLAAMLADIDSL